MGGRAAGGRERKRMKVGRERAWHEGGDEGREGKAGGRQAGREERGGREGGNEVGRESME